MNVTSLKNTNISFRDYWSPNTLYKAGDYIYVRNRVGYFYVALNTGLSQSETHCNSGLEEPVWKLFSYVYDKALQWDMFELQENTDFSTIQVWKPNTEYKIGDIVVPTEGVIVITGSTTAYYAFKVRKVITNIDWAIVNGERITEGDMIWETRISYSKLLPKARQLEPMYIELCQIMDYLQLHEEVYFNDILHKFGDRDKVRFDSLEQIIGEYGYTYISNALQYEEKELRALTSYLQMIHAFKGTKSGLQLVLELMGLQYHAEEWWEQNPKGEPHTWELYIEVDIEKAVANLAQRIITFTRSYVYPILSKFQITYKIDFIYLDIVMAGFIDNEYKNTLSWNYQFASIGGFIDRVWDSNFESANVETNRKDYIVTSGFVDKIFEYTAESSVPEGTSILHNGMVGFVDKIFYNKTYGNPELKETTALNKVTTSSFVDKIIYNSTTRNTIPPEGLAQNKAITYGFVDRSYYNNTYSDQKLEETPAINKATTYSFVDRVYHNITNKEVLLSIGRGTSNMNNISFLDKVFITDEIKR